MKKPVKDDSIGYYALAAGGFGQGFMHILIAVINFFRSSTESFTHLVIGICLIFCGWSFIGNERDQLTLLLAGIYIVQAALRLSAENPYWGVIDIIVGVGLILFIFRGAIKRILERIGIRAV